MRVLCFLQYIALLPALALTGCSFQVLPDGANTNNQTEVAQFKVSATTTNPPPTAQIESIVTDTPLAVTVSSTPEVNDVSGECDPNLLSKPWQLEAENDAAEAAHDLPPSFTLENIQYVRITFNLHGLMAQEGVRLNDATLVFNQPNWYGVTLINPKYGAKNGHDGDQIVDIPITEFLELPNPDTNTIGGRPLNLSKPVSSIRIRFWHTDHFTVDVSSIQFCK